jgi:Flp pilus assembly protein TadD
VEKKHTSRVLENAMMCHRSGRLAEAEDLCRRALKSQPHNPEVLNLLGLIASQTGQPRQAVHWISQAIAINARVPDYHLNHGQACHDLGKFTEAVQAYQMALQLRPDHAPTLFQLGRVLHELDKPDDAVQCYRQSIALDHDNPEACLQLGMALLNQGRVPEAQSWFEAATHLNPNFAEAHWQLALALLLMGDYPNGWREFEWRWQCPAYGTPKRRFPQPSWQGEPLQGKTILISSEQGASEAIQFIRYAPLVAQRGGRVVFECPPPLVPLLQTVCGIDQMVPAGNPLPPFDVYAPLLSLPHLFQTTLATVPASIPYLHPTLKSPLPSVHSARSKQRIGLAWTGDPLDLRSDLSLPHFAPLLALPDCSFHNLQTGPAHKQMAHLNPPANLRDLSGHARDLPHLAALIQQLDLVITPDATVAHLAGALGKKTWVLLPFAPHWRWLQQREDSPWYPTVRLFRQIKPGEWTDVIGRVAAALAPGHQG